MISGLALTDSRIEPGGGARLVIDEVDLSFGSACLLPSVRQRAQGIGGGVRRLSIVDGGGHGGHVGGGRCFSRVLPCRGSRQVAGK